MASRLGDVLYWAATLLACLFGALAVYLGFYETGGHREFEVGLVAVIGVVLWLIGRGVRYVLAGR